MFALLSRRYDTKETFGGFFVIDEDRLLAHVKMLELPYLENRPQISCIPPGEYDCERIHHRKYGVCFWIKDVPDRSGIIIHIGNFAAERKRLERALMSTKKIDTLGCPMPGLYFDDINGDGVLDVVASTKAMDILRGILPTKFKILIR